MVTFAGLRRPVKRFLERFSPTLVLPSKRTGTAILFLHHSTGHNVWSGGVAEWFRAYNARHGTSYEIVEQAFPKRTPYGWANYPYDYWNIWVNHQGDKAFMREPTLEMITARYDVVVFKHCFPVGKLQEDVGMSDIASQEKRMENYRLQYDALKKKMHEYPDKQFVVWTGPALVRGATNEAEAIRARAFFDWVRTEWDESGDNIFLWDFYSLETEGGLCLRDEYARGPNDSHLTPAFGRKVAPLFAQRVVDVIEGRGDHTSASGE